MFGLSEDDEKALDADRPPRRLPRIGLALGSGVARGWAHIGVLRELQRVGIEPDVICGTSIGALVGATYLAGKLDFLEEWALGLTKMGLLRYLDLSLNGGGLISGKKLAKLLQNSLGGLNIEDLDRPYAAVASDLVSGHEVWLRKGNLEEAIRASYALPGVFSPMRVDGRWLVDGALVNPVPISVCRALGAELVIAVNLNTYILRKRTPLPESEKFDIFEHLPKHRRGLRGMAPGNIIMRQLFGHEEHKPSTVNVMVAALNIIQDRLSRSRLAGDPPDVHIQPMLSQISLLEFDRAEEAIREGRLATEAALPRIQDALVALS